MIPLPSEFMQNIEEMLGCEAPAFFASLEQPPTLELRINPFRENALAAAQEFIDRPVFEAFDRVAVPEDEAYAANCLFINGKVLVPAGFPRMEAAVRGLGYETVIVDTSEYRKIDGGLSCLSLRF